MSAFYITAGVILYALAALATAWRIAPWFHHLSRRCLYASDYAEAIMFCLLFLIPLAVFGLPWLGCLGLGRLFVRWSR